ncbi:MAG: Ig-like domain-containing protein, partial [Actinomycetota bacterium]|nr:Ig-like domain-containing protein [Actinomycetota bacterium]
GVATSNELVAVSADSATDVWAVGWYVDVNAYGYPVDQLLVEHYNGTAWSLAPATASPFDAFGPRATENQFLGVAAASPTNVWAVGQYHSGSTAETLIEHFDGTSWSIVASPNPGTSANVLTAVALDGAGGADAVGYTSTGTVDQTLIEHYDGTAWSIVASPDTSTTLSNQLAGVTATSATDIWAVGTASGGTGTTPVDQTLIEHYDGTAWSIVSSPDTSTTLSNQLAGVAAASATDIWAVGTASGGTGTTPVDQTLIEHYDGTAWSIVASPDTSTTLSNQLAGVAATSAADIWAVGTASGGTGTTPVDQTLIVGSPPASTTSVTASVSSPVVGQAVTYTATVSGSAAATATGTVSFTDNGAPIPGCTSVPLASGAATCPATAGNAATHTVATTYSGDDVHLPSSGSLAVVVAPAATSTSLSAPFTSVAVGQAVTVTAAVTASAPGSGTPSGTVSFDLNGTALTSCTSVALTAGMATCSYTPSATGSLSFTASYSGSTDDLASTAPALGLSAVVAATTTTLVSAANPSLAGAPATYAASVDAVAPATGTPTGSVTFTSNGADLAGCVAVPLTSGMATCQVDMPLAGTFSIVATYLGSATDAGSPSPVLSQVVQAGVLTVQDIPTGSNPSQSSVTLSPVTLGSLQGPGPGGPQFAQATGTLDMVGVSDNRGTEPGWSVTGQLEGDFANASPVGPADDNVIPADFLTWRPSPVAPSPGADLSGVSAGPGATLSTTTPTVLCAATPGSGGGSYGCQATLSLAVPPYVAAGHYTATLLLITS